MLKLCLVVPCLPSLDGYYISKYLRTDQEDIQDGV
jgi:hypothetical protein